MNLYVKRDDFSGMSLFGGNKIRKLEYLLGDAKEKGCDTVFTYGATALFAEQAILGLSLIHI